MTPQEYKHTYERLNKQLGLYKVPLGLKPTRKEIPMISEAMEE